ncbi:MAG TPA: hypothetical protein VFR23_24685 [Jiangellaceae bacterium]|nr:hypothetical protein [Jiangellaceae bacterium]
MPGLPLTVRLDRLGRESSLIGDWQIDSSYLVSTDGFSFDLLSQNPTELRGLEAQPVTLVVGEHPQVVGRIDVTERESARSLHCEGRDYLADLVEGHVDPKLAFKDGMTLQAAVALACSPYGINLVLGDAAVTRNARTGARGGRAAPKDFLTLKLQDLKPESEQGVYDYVNRLAVRHGVTPQPTLNRNELLLQAPNYDQEPLYRLRRSLSPGTTNRIKRGVARRDFSSFPTFTVVRGLGGTQPTTEKTPKNASGLIDSALLTPETQAVAISGRVLPVPHGADADGRLYRLLSLHDRTARTSEQITAVAFRAIWDRLKETLTYRCTVAGHTDPDTGAVYGIDTIADIQDEVADVNERMWVYRRTLRFTAKGGAETDLECWRIGAYQLGASG